VRSVYCILDANFNRAREALRVLEDIARFHDGDKSLTLALKAARHAIDRHARPVRRELLGARESGTDVGRESDPRVRAVRSVHEIAAVNFKRAEEALRTIEEVAKGRYPGMCRSAHLQRFGVYTLEKAFADPSRRLRAARLYVLLDPDVARGPLDRVAREALRGGADILQLRQKPRPDAGLARELRQIARDSLFIVNDRPDVALAAGADGVHLGAGDLPVAEARRTGLAIVGATTHSFAEARRAAGAGADYLSVGPMFATGRKPDLEPRGFEYLAPVKRLGVPFFCIGGITRENVRPGMERVAVCAGVVAQRNVAAAARAIRARLIGRPRRR
jgi:thiamine-phosphate pyrophosphorylase